VGGGDRIGVWSKLNQLGGSFWLALKLLFRYGGELIYDIGLRGCTEVGESHLQGCGRVGVSIQIGAKCMREAKNHGNDISGGLQGMDLRVVPGYLLCNGAPLVSTLPRQE